MRRQLTAAYNRALWALCQWTIKELERRIWVSPVDSARSRAHAQGMKSGADMMHHLIWGHDMSPADACKSVHAQADEELEPEES